MRLVARDGVLLLQPGADANSSLWFSAASEPELRVWHKTLRALIDALDAAARIARLHVHENASLFTPSPFTELPHIGSRNLRKPPTLSSNPPCTHAHARAVSPLPLLG